MIDAWKKMINRNQFTIVWYVDENKLLYADPNMITDLLEEFRTPLGDLVITRDKKCTLLGINITIRDDKKIEIDMKDQLLEAIYMLQGKITVRCGVIT